MALRILFHLPYPGYHRLYGSTVRTLAERGHTVLLAYDSEKSRSPAAEAVEAAPGVEIVAPLPRRDGELQPLAAALRIGADYMRYLDPRFSGAPWLRERMERYLPESVAFLKEVPQLDSAGSETVMAYLRELERALPPAPAMTEAIAARRPDCVFVSPVLARGRSGVHQRDSVKSARAAGIPVGVGVASWDHLTSKGVLGELPDALYVWNEAQRREAVDLHGVPSSRIVITGAQAFDQWFERRPSLSRDDFAQSVGLEAGRPFLLYVGSSPNIAPVEAERAVVARWVEAVRASGDPDLAAAGVLIRPHPGNVAGWADADLSGFGNVIVSPRERPDIVMSDEEEMHYFHSLHHSACVVGVNTSAMIEAAIVGRPVHTFLAPEFEETQDGTLHFRLLRPEAGGCVRVAGTLDEHLEQLSQALADPRAHDAALKAFVGDFVRPKGLDRPAARVLAKAIERLPGV